MIKLEAISKIYRSTEVETTALDRVSLEAGAGEFVAIVGPSGCGKTTLLNVLGLLDAPTSGNYRLLDNDLSTHSERQLTDIRRGKPGIGFVFQNFHLIDDLSVADNVAVPLLYRPAKRGEREVKVQATLERLGIAHRAKHFPSELSGGQKQRAAIARAIVANPAIVLADEPTGNLDLNNGNEVVSILSDLAASGILVIMVTHSEAHASRAGRLIRLTDGRIIFDSKPTETSAA